MKPITRKIVRIGDSKQKPAGNGVGSGELVGLRLTRSELGLLQRVIGCDIDCGAEDPDFFTINKKLHALTKPRRSKANAKDEPRTQREHQ